MDRNLRHVPHFEQFFQPVSKSDGIMSYPLTSRWFVLRLMQFPNLTDKKKIRKSFNQKLLYKRAKCYENCVRCETPFPLVVFCVNLLKIEGTVIETYLFKDIFPFLFSNWLWRDHTIRLEDELNAF